MYLSMHETLNNIAKHNYQAYKFKLNEHANIDDIYITWIDRRKKQREVYEKGLEYIIIQSFAVEALLNFIGVKLYGNRHFKEHYESLKPTSKLLVFYQYYTKKDFDKSNKIWNQLKKLVKHRNFLAHCKPNTFNLDDDECFSKFDAFDKSITNDIHIIIGVFENIKSSFKLENGSNLFDSNQVYSTDFFQNVASVYDIKTPGEK